MESNTNVSAQTGPTPRLSAGFDSLDISMNVLKSAALQQVQREMEPPFKRRHGDVEAEKIPEMAHR